MSTKILDSFHPVVRAWFQRRFGAPTDAQRDGWPHIIAARDTLISAPTGSGKTLAAFLVAIDRLVRKAEAGELENRTEVVYVSPLKALSNDIQRNLDEPLAEIAVLAAEMGYDLPEIRTALRTGDTTQKERQDIIKRPPHILITTPESLYLMVTAERARAILRNVQTVIVDEVHALIRDKRGSHLSLTLARLDHINKRRPARVGLSATVKPIEYAAQFLVGTDNVGVDGTPLCEIIDSGYQRDLELTIECPPEELEAVASGEQWADIYNRLVELIEAHRTTIVFVNTRRLAERVAFKLSERLGEEHVGAHHGSLSKERRHRIEQKLKAGEMRALVATASLELGIDIGTVDLVCQLESPRSITTFLQRVGRSGHALGLTPKGALFPTSRDELVECAALVRAVKHGRLDAVFPPEAPLDILGQQIVAEAACEPWTEDDLFALARRAWPYKNLVREKFGEIVEMLSEGIAVGSGRAAHYLHRDRINGVVRGRRGARMTAIQCGGAIPELADYRVIAEPEGTFVGTLDEDFSIESMAGDIVLLGTTSWRIQRIESRSGIVRVENAHGAPPTIPFWNGEAPGRTIELSEEVSDLRIDISNRLSSVRPEPVEAEGRNRVEGFRAPTKTEESKPFLSDATASVEGSQPSTPDPAPIRDLVKWVAEECALPPHGAEQVVNYIRVQKEMMGVVPSQQDIVFERFFDESGGMQIVLHAPFGARINRAWGFALRKRFCVSFDFELQAAADNDAMLLSVGPNNSFPLEDMFGLVKPPWLRESVEQSLLVANAPVWQARWRWNTTRALAILRQRNGKRVPPPLQRMKADDLMAAVFPVLVACQENLSGPIPLPDHPLTLQTMHDCLTEAMDIAGLNDVLERIERGEIRVHARDTTEPSPFSHEMLNSKPYTYLDDAPLEERRARAVSLRRTLPQNGKDLGILDADAIDAVVAEAQPDPRDAEEVHDALLSLVAVRADFFPDWTDWLDELAGARRAASFQRDGDTFWFAAESLPAIERLFPGVKTRPAIELPPSLRREIEEHEARNLIVRGHLEVLGPTTVPDLAERTGLEAAAVASALAHLEVEGGMAMRGKFRVGAEEEEWCDRRLLARIHRYTLDRLRSEIEPVSAQDLMRFLFRWGHVAPGTQLEGKRGLLEAITQLQGYDIPAVAWERHILPTRISAYKGAWLDELCLTGDAAWARMATRRQGSKSLRPEQLAAQSEASVSKGPSSASSATPVSLARRADLPWLLAGVRGLPSGGSGFSLTGAGAAPNATTPRLRGAAAEIAELLHARGALFYDDIVAATNRLPTDVERGLWDLVAKGLATADGFQALRALMASNKKRQFRRPQRARLFRTLAVGGVPSGRWSLLPAQPSVHPEPARSEAEGRVEGLRSSGAAKFGDGHDSQLATEALAEAWAEQLLFRYGVVFRDLARQENIGVPWREILRVLRRMEAQGIVRGGRFVAGFYGEQYARPEAVESLRNTRRAPKNGELIRLSAVDPLNLTGVITPGPRVPSIHTKSVYYRDGIPITEEEFAVAQAERHLAGIK
ncbi:MAG TPA: DEAD/DEAH box helicase [Dehalococcoidia bacterium]|nr:DEAD/DEAH box helicase [Dehalococcoidia bacterium]